MFVNCRLMLLDSPTHTEKLIVQTLTAVVANVNEQQAKNCFHTSKQLGQAMITSCIKEHAEFFAQQLNRLAQSYPFPQLTVSQTSLQAQTPRQCFLLVAQGHGS